MSICLQNSKSYATQIDMYTYTMHTFGCQMNVGDSIWLKRALRARGFLESLATLDAHNAHPVDISILYTCSVREKPEQKVYQIISRLQHIHRDNPRYTIAVGGCVAQQLGESLLKRFPCVRLVFGSDNNSYIPEAIARLLEDPSLEISLIDFTDTYPERDFSIANDVSPVEYVNIMQGCDNFCTYCIVPFTRGKQKSRKSSDILQECHLLVERGAKEIMLLGQNVNSYGKDNGEIPFSSLLQNIQSIQGLEKLSFMTPHPKDFDDETIQCFANNSILSSKIHLPLQSGSDKILTAMGRQYTKKDYILLVEKIKDIRPEAVFSTDIIVGFPGETEEDFSQTIEVMHEIGFAQSYSFCYSDRPGTQASLSANKIEKSIAMERLSRLQQEQDRLRESYLHSFVGKTIQVLLENTTKRNKEDTETSSPLWFGRDIYGNAVHVANVFHAKQGEITPVHITQATRTSLYGISL